MSKSNGSKTEQAQLTLDEAPEAAAREIAAAAPKGGRAAEDGSGGEPADKPAAPAGKVRRKGSRKRGKGAASAEAAAPAAAPPAAEAPDRTPPDAPSEAPAAAPAETPSEAPPEAPPEAPAAATDSAEPRVMRLVHNAEGCWKELEDGTRVELSEADWRTELARHFRRPGPGAAEEAAAGTTPEESGHAGPDPGAGTPPGP